MANVGAAVSGEGEVLGIDVSHHQGDIDWEQVGEAVYFAFIRKTHGRTVDRCYLRNWAHARDHMLAIGAYHYFERCDWDVQAEAFCKGLACPPGTLPPVLDIEEGEPDPTELLAWLDCVEASVHRAPWIYTCAGWWDAHIGEDNRFARYPLWVADWSGKVSVPKSWNDWLVHQRSSAARVPGVKTPVDLDVFNGSMDTLCFLASLR